MKSDDLLLYAVTDRAWLGGRTLVHDAELAIKGGATMLQLQRKAYRPRAVYDRS